MPLYSEKPEACDKCGACCEFECVPPLSRGELEALPEPLRTETAKTIREFVREIMPDRPCTWWDARTQLCIYHDTHLPARCRSFVVNGEPCGQVRRDHPLFAIEVGRLVRPAMPVVSDRQV